MFLGFLLALALLVLVLAVIDKPAHRRLRIWRNFYEIEPACFRFAQGVLWTHDAELFTFFVDDADLGRANLMIDARSIFYWIP